jgi:KipI family sensor histidine kinase inhibitor
VRSESSTLLDGLADPGAVAEAVRCWTPEATETEPTSRVEIPVVYDGADLADVARLWDTDERGVVARLTETELTVAFCGFSPGFAYLAGLPPELAVPRLPSPRAKVPEGSVGLADAYAGIYPTASPGGWRLVGRTDARLFDPERTPPALLTPGVRVRLVEATAS